MKSVLIIGLNHFGSLLAKRIHALGHEIMAVDKDEKLINEILPDVTDAQIGDSTNESFLRSLGVDNYDVCFVSIEDDFQSSLVTTALCKELGGKFVVSLADIEIQATFLKRNGADEVINPERQMAEWSAVRYTSNHILDYIKLDDEHAIYEVSIPEEWHGKSIGQIDVRKKYEINIIAVVEDGKRNLSVMPDTILDNKKTLLVLGTEKAIQKCFKI